MVATHGDYAPETPLATARRSWRLTAILIFLGLLSLAAAATARVECGPVLLRSGTSVLTGGGALLTGGRQCEIQAGGYRYRLPWPLS
jgi:hypothetical protein